MLDHFLTQVQADDAAAPFEPTEADFLGECPDCGADLYEWEECDCADDREPSDDFPMRDEYDGPYGLSGYDSFYDSCTDLGGEW